MGAYDVIVVGAGHAGVEAAFSGARLGLKVLLATTNLTRISFMSCNPAIGGVGKGHIVREIEALGGQMALAADESCIQFKRLNQRKGPAVRGRRMQCDKNFYTKKMRQFVLQEKNIELKQLEIKKLQIKNSICEGVVTSDGVFIRGKTVVITTGTFMGAIMHTGSQTQEGGRVGDKATIGLSDQLKQLGLQVERLKTGTPPRIYKGSVDWKKTQVQRGDPIFQPFSLLSHKQPKLPQVACYLTYTNEKTHEIIRNHLQETPLYTGAITGPGPRYCPSVEEKVTRFQDKTRHQTFLEPESLETDSIYVQGLSTRLP
ncbi:MAG: FAD-dependent oxidoreductase, partial [Bdellovibrionales bacterium]